MQCKQEYKLKGGTCVRRFKINWLVLFGFSILIAGLTVVFVLDDLTVIGQFLDFIEFPLLAVIGGLGGAVSVKW